jgi:hypothetical protein
VRSVGEHTLPVEHSFVYKFKERDEEEAEPFHEDMSIHRRNEKRMVEDGEMV